MEQTLRRAWRRGAAALLCAVCVRLYDADAFSGLTAFPDNLSIFQNIETGRDVRSSDSLETVWPFPAESARPYFPEETAVSAVLPTEPVFSQSDADAISVKYMASLRPDLGALLVSPLTLTLDDEAPRVLILHTHTTESYTKAGEDYRESSAYRTLDEQYNMVSIGDELARILEEGGIGVLHDRQVHDYPSYNGAYTHARKAIAAALAEYPTIQIILDIHRDAAGEGKNQMRTEVRIGEQMSAQLMLIVASGSAALPQEHWQENLSLALKLQVILERLCPGIMRPICLRPQRFNQDLSPGALLVEVGAAGNTHAEAILAARQLAQGILALKEGG